MSAPTQLPQAPKWLLAMVLTLPSSGGAALAAGAAADSAPQHLPITAQACLGRQRDQPPLCIELELPRGIRQYAIGLQRRGPLPPRRGMWFGYEPPQVARFWMHQTPEPLDMLFLRAGRVIAIVAPALPCPHLPCRSYGPDTEVDGVLEIGAGQAAALGITEGTVLRLEPINSSARAAPAPD